MAEPVLDTRPVVLETRPVLETRALGSAPGAGARFTVGGLVSRTLSTWWRHLIAFGVLSLATNAPMALWMWGMLLGVRPERARDPAALQSLVLFLPLVWLVVLVLAVVQVGAVTCGTVRHLEGKRASLGEMLRVGARRGLPVVGTGLLLWLAVLAGTIALVVPGVLLGLAASVAIPAAVVERPGVTGAISRSFALTRGHRWGLLGGFLALSAIAVGLAMLLQVFLSVAAPLAAQSPEGIATLVAGAQLGGAIFSAIPAVGMAVAYHDLRLEKEGVDASELARIFE